MKNNIKWFVNSISQCSRFQSGRMANTFLMLFMFYHSLHNGIANDLAKVDNYRYHMDLYKMMLGNYDKRIIPQCSDNPLKVTIQLAPREIVDLREQQENGEFQLWVRLSWFDCNLVWNKTDYRNISWLVVSYEDIWVPDITLIEGIDFIGNMPNMKQYRARITSNGQVHFNFLTVVNTVCHMDLTYYPFDVQMFDFTFTSWIYTSDALNIQAASNYGDLTYFSPNQEFIVKEVAATSITQPYPCCGGNFSLVTFTLKIKRRPTFFMATIVVPFFIITILSFAGFALPSISGEKITFHTTILLATVVFLLLVQDQFPSTSETFPKIAIYFSISMILSCVSCVMSAIVMYIYYNDLSGKKMHKWVKLIFIEWLGKIMLVTEIDLPYHICKVQQEGSIQRKPTVSQEEIRKSRKSRKSLKDLEAAEKIDYNSIFLKGIHEDLEDEKSSPNKYLRKSPCNDHDPTRNDLDPSTRKMNDWELLAYTVDRFFTVFYVSVTVLNSFVFLIIMKSQEDRIS